MGQIYILENQLNSKCYIGKTIYTVEKRLEGNQGHLKSKCYIGRALRKYGIDNFNVYTHDIDNKSLNYYEIKFIKMYDSYGSGGYNLTIGGEGVFGYKHTKEAIKKSTKSGKDHGMYGKKHSEESKLKMSINSKGICGGPNFKGHYHSEESKLKMSEAMKKYWISKRNDK